jgi:hypothetical protein
MIKFVNNWELNVHIDWLDINICTWSDGGKAFQFILFGIGVIICNKKERERFTALQNLL